MYLSVMASHQGLSVFDFVSLTNQTRSVFDFVSLTNQTRCVFVLVLLTNRTQCVFDCVPRANQTQCVFDCVPRANLYVPEFRATCCAHSPWTIGGAQGAVGRHCDAVGVTVIDQLRLIQIWAALHLRHTGKGYGTWIELV